MGASSWAGVERERCIGSRNVYAFYVRGCRLCHHANTPAASALLNTWETCNVYTHDEVIACSNDGGGVHAGGLAIA
jgi:hypothetical protein